MRVYVFDDKMSLLHLPVGVLSYFFPVLLVVFFGYEFVEFMFKSPKEKAANFCGDLLEFMLGVSLTHFVVKLISI